jgi:hypothetical protein
MEWFTDEQRARREAYNRAAAPYLAYFASLGNQGKAIQRVGMRTAWGGLKLTIGIVILVVLIIAVL